MDDGDGGQLGRCVDGAQTNGRCHACGAAVCPKCSVVTTGGLACTTHGLPGRPAPVVEHPPGPMRPMVRPDHIGGLAMVLLIAFAARTVLLYGVNGHWPVFIAGILALAVAARLTNAGRRRKPPR